MEGQKFCELLFWTGIFETLTRTLLVVIAKLKTVNAETLQHHKTKPNP